MFTSEFDYHLPLECIAQTPIEPRHNSRLMILRRGMDEIEHSYFYHLYKYLSPGDLLVLNQTRVIPARLFARKPTGGKVEILLLRRVEPQLWESLVGGKGLHEGVHVKVEGGPEIEIIQVLEGSRRLVRFTAPIDDLLPQIGEMPLPPYIHEKLQNPERYQTVYATVGGSAAAPTAGLHFTPSLISELEDFGVRFTRVTLHVGLDTFAPVTEEHPEEHTIHTEWCELTAQSAELINQTRKQGGKVVAVGTTSVRTLESAAVEGGSGGMVSAFQGPTNLFILPGYTFRVTDAIITNFHLPRSTLIMLVSAFAGKTSILAAYQDAIQHGYRFYSFGDAMLLL